MFVRYAFGIRSDRAFPTARFERCTHDAVHCVSERRAGQGATAPGERTVRQRRAEDREALEFHGFPALDRQELPAEDR
ncbi:hypothetical protein ADK64_16425 [Streptomyces sp. MMG1121]|nr:hypothetical protein ADK64_16425 [Streptomyces sp. MMG1121]